jgi:hypothetical protein
MDTSQPTNLTTAEWCDWGVVINAGLVYLKKGGKAMTEEEIIEKFISVNLRSKQQKSFSKTMWKTTRGRRERKKKESSKKERKARWKKSTVNMCWLKGHNHAWNKCPNNPISKNFPGKSYTEIPTSERYENNFWKESSDQEDSQWRKGNKKVSIKNGECHFI